MCSPRTIPGAGYLLAAALLAACGPPAAAPALPLQPEDFTLWGLPEESDSAEIRLSFGEPDSVAVMDNPFEDAPLVTWFYPDLEVRFGAGGRPLGFVVEGGSEGTARGARIGDTARQVRQLYGTPSSRTGPSWTYVAAEGNDVLRVIDFTLHNDTVVRIYIGRAIP